MNKEILELLKSLGFQEKKANSEFWKFESFETYLDIPKSIEDKSEVMKFIIRELYSEIQSYFESNIE